MLPPPKKRLSKEIIVAIIGALAIILVAIISNILGPLILLKTPTPTPTSTNTPTLIPTHTPGSTHTQDPSHTPSPTLTERPPGVILFEDDFENGLDKWKPENLGGIIVVEDDNSSLCFEPQDQFNYMRTIENEWTDYELRLDFVIKQTDIYDRGGYIDVRYSGKNINGYDFQLSEGVIDFNKLISGENIWLDKTWTPIDLSVGEINNFRVIVIGSDISSYLNDELVIQFEDSELSQGGVRLGAMPNAEICFDNIQVIGSRTEPNIIDVFEDDFSSNEIDPNKWDKSTIDAFSIIDGQAVVNYANDTDAWKGSYLFAKLSNPPYQIIQFDIGMISGMSNGQIGFNTTCNENDSSFKFGIRVNEYEAYIDENDTNTHINLEHSFLVGETYSFRFVQEEGFVRIYINEVEISETLPCVYFGNWFTIAGSGTPGSSIEGFFDNVQLSKLFENP